VVEIKIKPGVEGQIPGLHIDHVDLVIAFDGDNAGRGEVLVEEVIAYDPTGRFPTFGTRNVPQPSNCTQVVGTALKLSLVPSSRLALRPAGGRVPAGGRPWR
jgi:hypothetical protein